MDKNKLNNSLEDNAVGLGVDIVDVQRIQDIIDKTPNFIEHTFCDDEIKYCKSSSRWAEHFATHFAAKEAVVKALGLGFSNGIQPKDIEVKHNDKGKPWIVLYDKAKEEAEKLNVVKIPISLSFTNKEAVGFAIALTDNTSKQKDVLEKSKDPMAELTKQFKQAKQILDDDNLLKKSMSDFNVEKKDTINEEN